jgi:hypothetical protein
MFENKFPQVTLSLLFNSRLFGAIVFFFDSRGKDLAQSIM